MHPYWRASFLLLTDLAAATISLGTAIGLRYLWDRSLLWDAYIELWPMLFLFPLAYALAGLYGVGIAPPEELRRLSYATSLVFLVLGGATFMYKSAAEYSRGAFVFAWGLALVLVPLGRALAREMFARKSWWGAPVVVLGAGKTGEEVVRALERQPGLGLKPIALLDDDPHKHGLVLGGVQVVGGLELAEQYAKAGVKHAILAMPGVPRNRLLELIETYGHRFPHLIVIPDLLGLSSLWVASRDIGGILGLELQHKLLSPASKVTKLSIDWLLALVCFLLSLPLLGLIWVLVKTTSIGPAFYIQSRLGHKGKIVNIIKFRTMYGDGEKRLAQVLAQNESLRIEYEQFHKLRNDPRLTPLGKWLRRFSLDELPQIINVLKGEISLIGPRAYLPREKERIGKFTKTILSVKPGVTGLWQVSGRNELTFEERLQIDVYYVRNWSIWLDLYILARTVWVVLTGKGAY
ncbi:undecaprenyl-phosphate galactose phosphotransferase WbaP [Meiothermus sp. QL-1]|nr:undecaprenyl-phosphate galactose phosphotransferase WbaP [Meiothermus sp. QL-1]